jgi:hypothetical protein
MGRIGDQRRRSNRSLLTERCFCIPTLRSRHSDGYRYRVSADGNYIEVHYGRAADWVPIVAAEAIRFYADLLARPDEL